MSQTSHSHGLGSGGESQVIRDSKQVRGIEIVNRVIGRVKLDRIAGHCAGYTIQAGRAGGTGVEVPSSILVERVGGLHVSDPSDLLLTHFCSPPSPTVLVAEVCLPIPPSATYIV